MGRGFSMGPSRGHGRAACQGGALWIGGSVADLTGVEQRLKEARIKTGLRKCIAFGQNRYRVVAVKRFLMAGRHTEIADTGVAFHGLAKKPYGVFDKDRV